MGGRPQNKQRHSISYLPPHSAIFISAGPISTTKNAWAGPRIYRSGHYFHYEERVSLRELATTSRCPPQLSVFGSWGSTSSRYFMSRVATSDVNHVSRHVSISVADEENTFSYDFGAPLLRGASAPAPPVLRRRGKLWSISPPSAQSNPFGLYSFGDHGLLGGSGPCFSCSVQDLRFP